MVNCDVKFDNNPQGVYYSGQTLSGVVELNNEKARNVRGLTLRIEGYAKVDTLVFCYVIADQSSSFLVQMDGERGIRQAPENNDLPWSRGLHKHLFLPNWKSSR